MPRVPCWAARTPSPSRTRQALGPARGSRGVRTLRRMKVLAVVGGVLAVLAVVYLAVALFVPRDESGRLPTTVYDTTTVTIEP